MHLIPLECKSRSLVSADHILEVLAKYFRHPDKHHNDPFGTDDGSLLHTAAELGDWRAARYLL